MPSRGQPYQVHPHGVALYLRVIPRASANRIVGLHRDADGMCQLKVQVTAVPENGKANAAVIKLLATECTLAKSQFELKAGATDRNKTILIHGDASMITAAVACRLRNV